MTMCHKVNPYADYIIWMKMDHKAESKTIFVKILYLSQQIIEIYHKMKPKLKTDVNITLLEILCCFHDLILLL